MLKLVAIFLGGGFGCLIRYAVSFILKPYCMHFPFATFVVNILGSFLLGFIFALTLKNPNFSPALKLALSVGFCGGLTTFSTFSLESFEIIRNGEIVTAFWYIMFSVLLCILSVFAGVVAAKYV